MVKSILSGLVILTDKPFTIGDWIEVGDYEGTVIDITFRSVRLKSYNNAIVTIPNSTITQTYVSNWNKLTSRRFDCTLGLSLNTPTEKVRKVIKEIRTTLKNHKDVISDTVTVCLNDITTGSINIKIFLYMSETNYGLSLMVRQDIYCSLLYLMEKEDIELVSYPTQTVYLNGKDEEKTEQ
jgi:MscS family membrane protein